MQSRARSNWLPYLAAVAAVVVAAVSGRMLAPVAGDNVLYITFFAAVSFAAWYGGFWPAISATALTYLVANLFFISQDKRFEITVTAFAYIFACFLIAVLGEAMRRARRRAEAIAEEIISIVESITDGFIAVDGQWKCTYMNRSAQEFNRRHRRDGHATAEAEIFPVLTSGGVEARLKQAAHSRETVEFETFYEPWKQWFEVKASPAEAGGIGVFFRDITERKQAQLALAQSEERLRLAQRGAKAGLWDWDMISGKGTWSEAYYEINGLDPAIRPSRKNFLRSVYPDDRVLVERSIAEAIREHKSIMIEYRIAHLQKGIRWIAGRGRITVDDAGRPARASGIVLDITERKQAEESLRFLSEAGTVLATLVDLESTLQSVARLAVSRFADWCVVETINAADRFDHVVFAHRDLSKEPILKQFMSRIGSEHASTPLAARVLESGKPELITTVTPDVVEALVDRDRRQLLVDLDPVSLIVVPLVIRDRPVGALTFVSCDPQSAFLPTDLKLATEIARRLSVASENVRLYAELKEAQRQKDDFLAMLAHELRNPLAAISYANEVSKLAQKASDGPADTIDRQLANLCRLLDDLLDISRITRDKVQLKRELVDGAELARRAAATVCPFIEERKHTLQLEISDEAMPLDVDPIRVEQILGNLLTNAAKYTPEGGTITLRAQPLQDHAVFSVKDTGIGISPSKLPQIFELFMQVDRSIDRSQGGLGVGLTLVRKLAEMHGGSVSAKSDGPGQGSEFTIRLPLAEKRAAQTADMQPAAAAHNSQPLKVLMVDDNVDLAESISRLLKRCGHTVATAHDGYAAIEKARTFAPDVVLLDLGLPGLDGYRVAQTLRGEVGFSGVRFIAFSGYGQPEDRKRTREAGFDNHLVKPVKFQTLLSAIAAK